MLPVRHGPSFTRAQRFAVDSKLRTTRWTGILGAASALTAVLFCRWCFAGGPACPPPSAPAPAPSTDEAQVATSSTDPSLPITFWNTGSCPFAQRVWIVLLEKELPFKLEPVEMQNKPVGLLTAYASANTVEGASAKVPVIETADKKVVIESDIVSEYLNEKFPSWGNALMPESPEQRVRVKLLAKTFDETIGSQAYQLLTAAGEELRSAVDLLRVHLKAIDKFLDINGMGNGPFLCGELFSLAEVHVAPFLQRMLLTLRHFQKLDLISLSSEMGLRRIQHWIQAISKRPSVMQTSLPPAVLIESYKQLLERRPA